MRICILLLLILFISCTTSRNKRIKIEHSFGITGHIQGEIEGYERIYLLQIMSVDDFYNGSSHLVIDSATIHPDGGFCFPNFNDLDTNYVYRLNIVRQDEPNGMIVRDYKRNNYLFLLNEKEPLKIWSKLPLFTKNARIECASQRNIKMLHIISDMEEGMYTLANEYYKKIDKVSMDSMMEDKLKSQLMKNMINHLKSVLIPKLTNLVAVEKDPRVASLLLASIGVDFKMENEIELYKSIIKNNSKTHLSHPYIIEYEKIILKSENGLQKNAKVPNIELESTEGKPVSLYDIKSKLMLINFWASWCSPCRKKNKYHLKPLYDKYKEKGFIVIGVSIDKDKEKWLRAIKQDSTTWIQLVTPDVEMAKKIKEQFNFTTIPEMILIDDNHRIILRKVDDDALDDFLTDYYRKHKK